MDETVVLTEKQAREAYLRRIGEINLGFCGFILGTKIFITHILPQLFELAKTIFAQQ